MELDDGTLEDLYCWIDQHRLSRPKRNISRDFSDGVLIAEVLKHHIPKMVEIHNYTSANSTKQKMENWYLLNRRVFQKLNFELSEDVISSVVQCIPFAIEKVLILLRSKLPKSDVQDKYVNKQVSEKPEADQEVYKQSPARQEKSVSNKPQKRFENSNIGYSDVVNRELFDEKEQECLAKDETIQILQAKIRRLEHLVTLKDQRIEDLQKRLQITNFQSSVR